VLDTTAARPYDERAFQHFNKKVILVTYAAATEAAAVVIMPVAVLGEAAAAYGPDRQRSDSIRSSRQIFLTSGSVRPPT